MKSRWRIKLGSLEWLDQARARQDGSTPQTRCRSTSISMSLSILMSVSISSYVKQKTEKYSFRVALQLESISSEYYNQYPSLSISVSCFRGPLQLESISSNCFKTTEMFPGFSIHPHITIFSAVCYL